MTRTFDRMATVRVFVDDAVTGHLPDVCVKDGVVAHGWRMALTEEVGSRGLGLLWLLVFLGPIGWLTLLVAATVTRGERLTVTLPMGLAAQERYQALRRGRNTVVGVGAAAGLLLVALALTTFPELGLLGVLVLGGTFVAWMVAEYRVGQSLVDVRLDASRRWATLRGLHPAFARAVEARATLS
jgi:hypothetical protein